MKILGKIKKNFVVELTPREMEIIETSLFEWGEIEDAAMQPDRSIKRLLLRMVKAQNKFNSLPIITVQKQLKGSKHDKEKND